MPGLVTAVILTGSVLTTTLLMALAALATLILAVSTV